MALPPDNQHITYQLQHRKCGKSSCSTCRKGPGHGPYWYAYWREGTRLRSGYIGKVNPYLPAESSQENDSMHEATAISSLNEQRKSGKRDASLQPPESFVITSKLA